VLHDVQTQVGLSVHLRTKKKKWRDLLSADNSEGFSVKFLVVKTQGPSCFLGFLLRETHHELNLWPLSYFGIMVCE